MHRALDFFCHIVTSPSLFVNVRLLQVCFFFLFLSFSCVGITYNLFFFPDEDMFVETSECVADLSFFCEYVFLIFQRLFFSPEVTGFFFSIYRSSSSTANSARHSMKVSLFLAGILVVVNRQ